MKGDAISAGDTTNMDHYRRGTTATPRSPPTVPLSASAMVSWATLKSGCAPFRAQSFAYVAHGSFLFRHLNIGAGRVVWQDILRIGKAVDNGEFQEMPNIVECCKHAKEGSGRLHLLGLVSFTPQNIPIPTSLTSVVFSPSLSRSYVSHVAASPTHAVLPQRSRHVAPLTLFARVFHRSPMAACTRTFHSSSRCSRPPRRRAFRTHTCTSSAMGATLHPLRPRSTARSCSSS